MLMLSVSFARHMACSPDKICIRILAETAALVVIVTLLINSSSAIRQPLYHNLKVTLYRSPYSEPLPQPL